MTVGSAPAQGDVIDDLADRARAITSLSGEARAAAIEELVTGFAAATGSRDLYVAPRTRFDDLEARLTPLVRELESNYQGYASHLFARVRSLRGEYPRAIEILTDALDRLPDEVYGREQLQNALATNYAHSGQIDLAHRQLDANSTWCQEHECHSPSTIHGTRGELFLRTGLVEQAAKELALEWDLAGASDNHELFLHAVERQGDYCLTTGRYDQIAELIEAAEERFGTEPIPPAIRGQLGILEGFGQFMEEESDPDAPARARETLESALASPALPSSWRVAALLKLLKSSLSAGDLEQAETDLAACAPAFEGVADVGRKPIYHALRSWYARASGADRSALLREHAGLAAAYEILLDEWRRLGAREGGTGFFHLTERRLVLGELIELTLATHDEHGTETALEFALRAQALNSIAQTRGIPGCDVATIQRRMLRPGDGVLVYLPWRLGTHVFAITRDGVKHFALEPQGEILSHVARFALRLSVDPEDARNDPTTGVALEVLGRRVRERVLPDPVWDEASSWQTLTIVGGDLLPGLSFAALPLASGNLLGETIPIAELDALPLGVGLLDQRAPGQAGAPTIQFIGCTDSKAPEFLQQDIRQVAFPRAEVSAILDAYDGASLALFDSDATLRAVTDLDLTAADVHHFVAHHLRDPEVELGAGLALHDRVLRHQDVRRTRVAGLCILSACEAGRGPRRVGDSVLATNLGGAFMRSGAHTIVQPLVPVALKRHLALMRPFHAELADGASPAAALQRARRELAERAPTDMVGRFYRAQVQVHGLGHRSLR